jgi:probable rRNA maturation factor
MRASTPPAPVTRVNRYTLLNKQRAHPIDSRGIHRFLADLLAEFKESEEKRESSFAVVFVTDEVMRTYNHRYRGMDKPTDVLSFEGEDDYLGDILISTETAWSQARKSPSLSFDKNIRRLLLHGFLHLSGYDHETDNGEMRAVERRLRRRFGC